MPSLRLRQNPFRYQASWNTWYRAPGTTTIKKHSFFISKPFLTFAFISQAANFAAKLIHNEDIRTSFACAISYRKRG